MDIQFYGANCVSVTYKGTRVVIDDNLAALGGKSVLKADDIALYTTDQTDKPAAKLLIDHPGEYEVSDISIHGVAAQAHMDPASDAGGRVEADNSKKQATMYKITAGDLNLLFTGHIYPDISEAQLEEIGKVDVMFVPVGGNGYTLDAIGALKLIKEVEPKLIIPTHYADKSLSYEVPQQDLPQALHELGMEPKETTGKLKLKSADLSDVMQLIVLEKS